MVLHLAQTIPSHNNHALFFDNWFTSLPLLDHLAERGIWCCGTIRAPRLHGLSKEIQSSKDLQKKPRGSHEEYKITMDNSDITYVKWNDNKAVNMVSTFAKSNPIKVVPRYDSKQKKQIDVPRPNMI